MNAVAKKIISSIYSKNNSELKDIGRRTNCIPNTVQNGDVIIIESENI